jgi:putative Mg2+ transporter-C (MgtC) family protein
VSPGELAEGMLKLTLACLLGGMVGWQREAQERPAGFRTHILVCAGACLVMLVSIGVGSPALTGGPRYDPGRIAAQVVSGIGFLGAGTILRQGNIVRGLTTAASLWTVAAIGLAAGLGGAYLLLATFATVLVLATLTLFGLVERRLIARRSLNELRITLPQESAHSLVRFFADRGARIRRIERTPPNPEGVQRLHLILSIPPQVPLADVTHDLLAIPGVREVELDGMLGS